MLKAKLNGAVNEYPNEAKYEPIHIWYRLLFVFHILFIFYKPATVLMSDLNSPIVLND